MKSETNTEQHLDETNRGNKIEKALISYPNLKHLAILSCLLLLSFLSYRGFLSSWFDYFINQHIFQVDRAYLNQANETADKTLVVVSSLKAVLAVLQSSRGGISLVIDVNAQLGQVFNVISELINLSWLISLGSVFSIKVLGILLDLAKFSMAPLLTLFFMLYGLSYGLSFYFTGLTKVISYLARSGLFLVIVVHLVIPLTIYLCASINYFYFHEHKSAIHQTYQSISVQLPKHDSSDSLHNQVKGVIKVFEEKQKYLHEHSGHITHLTLSHMAYSMVEYILMPLLLLTILILTTRALLNKLWAV